MGASMGGLMARYSALRAPDIFGQVLCESGALGPTTFIIVSVIYHSIRCGLPPALRIWMDVGLHEWFLAPTGRWSHCCRNAGYNVE